MSGEKQRKGKEGRREEGRNGGMEGGRREGGRERVGELRGRGGGWNVEERESVANSGREEG